MLGQTFVTVLCVYLASCQVNANLIQEANAIKEKVMENYKKDTVPSPNGDPLTASVMLMLSNIGNLDERQEKLTTIMILIINWRDVSLAWDTTNSSVFSMHYDKEDVFVPEFFLMNQHSQIDYGVDEMRYLPVEYYSDGSARFTQMITAETLCQLDTTAFPFDEHTCDIKLIVNKNNVQVQTMFQSDIFNLYQPDGSWDVIKAESIAADSQTIVLRIVLARKPAFVLVNLIIPMALLALLSPLVFLLPNQSGERVGFSITVLLATSVFMTIVADHVPQKSKPFPLVLTLFFIIYSLTVLVVFIVIINARIYRLPGSVKIPRPLLGLVRCTRCFCCCFRRRRGGNESDDDDDDDDGGEEMALNDSEKKKAARKGEATWKDVGWAIDMLFMIVLYVLKILFVVLFLVLLSSKVTES